MKKKLHELIEMAERGEKFESFLDSEWAGLKTQDDFKRKDTKWLNYHVTADWTVRMKREPRVWEFKRTLDGEMVLGMSIFAESLAFGEKIKVIEVIEDEPETI